MSFRTILVCGLLVAVVGASAEVYRSRDANGNIVFSDTPAPGAERIELKETTIVPALEAPRATTRLKPPVAAVAGYSTVEITSPAEKETLRNVPSVQVSVAVTPELRSSEGDSIQLYVDGSPFAAPATGTTFTLPELGRGEHRLEAAVVNAAGEELKRSAPRVFYLHKHSVQHPPPANPGPRAAPAPG